MIMAKWIFVSIAVLFVFYMIWRYYGSTPTDKAFYERMWLAFLAAATSLGAALTAWFHSTP